MIVDLWTAIASDTAVYSGNLGVCDDDLAARVAAERWLREGSARLAYVETASQVTEAHSFSPCYLLTGAGWWATRDPDGDVQWVRFTGAEAAAWLPGVAGSGGSGPAHDI